MDADTSGVGGMNEMIERVARAICKQDGCNPDDEGTTLTLAQYGNIKILPSGGYCAPAWEFYVAKAIAAIEAMREPTEEMLEAGPLEPYMDKDIWGKMIDAALKE
jgi:hypothetical protein